MSKNEETRKPVKKNIFSRYIDAKGFWAWDVTDPKEKKNPQKSKNDLMKVRGFSKAVSLGKREVVAANGATKYVVGVYEGIK